MIGRTGEFVRAFKPVTAQVDSYRMSPLERALVGMIGYGMAMLAASKAGLLTGPPTPPMVQLAVSLGLAACYGFVAGTWWTLLPPALAIGLVLLAYGDDPSFIENADASLGGTFAILITIAAGAITVGVIARKLLRRSMRDQSAPG